MRYITFALAKGRLAKHTLGLLEQIGITCEEMKDEKKVDKLLKNAKKTLNIAYNDFYESSNKIIDYYFIREFTILPSIEERREKVMNLTSKDVTDIAKKVSIGLIYLMEGTL